MRRTIQFITVIALIVGIGGRFWGAWVNNESNDNHVEVVQRILAGQSIEHKDSCWECFQPPTHYRAHAGLSKITGAESRRALIQQMQLTNAVLSILIIFLAYLIWKKHFGDGHITRVLWLFALLNPALFSMSIQGTNDLPVILLSAVAFYSLIRYLRTPQMPWLILMGISAFVCAIFKGSGVAMFLMFSTWLIGLAIWQKHYAALVVPLLGFCFLLLFSQYRHNYDSYGHAMQTNLEKPEPPPWFESLGQTVKRPGINSIWSGFGTFRIGNMMIYPFNINDHDGRFYPEHRTSFWSQLYGSFWDIQFLQHPYTWMSKHPDRLNLVRTTFFLGLLISTFFAWALITSAGKLLKPGALNERMTLLAACSIFGGTLVFNLMYAYAYRDFGCMKAIFMLPALLPMAWIYSSAWYRLKAGVFKTTLQWATVILLLLTAANLVFLLVRLTRINYGFLQIV